MIPVVCIFANRFPPKIAKVIESAGTMFPAFHQMPVYQWYHKWKQARFTVCYDWLSLGAIVS